MATTEPRGRTRYTAVQRQELLAQYGRSGLSASAFAREHGINLSTLYQWSQRMKSAPRHSVPLFKEIMLSGGPLAPTWAAEITVGHEITVRLGSAISAKLITQVIQQLRRPC